MIDESTGLPVALPVWSSAAAAVTPEAPAVAAVTDGRYADPDLLSMMTDRDEVCLRLEAARDAVARWSEEYEQVCRRIDERCRHQWVRTRTDVYEKEYRCTICQSDRIV